MAYGGKGLRGAKRPFAPTRGRKKSKMAPYYTRGQKKTFGKYSAMTLYKYPTAQTSTTRYFTCVKYLTSQAVTDIVNNKHAAIDGSVKCLKSAVRAGDLVDCALFEKARFSHGGFRLEHVGASWTLSTSNELNPANGAPVDFAPIAYSSMLVQDFKDATGVTGAGTDGSNTVAWLSHHDQRTHNGTTQAEFHDITAIDSNINTKVHTMKTGSTTISRFYKTGKRFDQRGSHSLTAAGTAAQWLSGQAQELRTALDEQCKMSLLFFVPKATVSCAIVTTFKVSLMGQPNF